MPLRTALALKHNQKADPHFATTEKTGRKSLPESKSEMENLD
jgi:hypothetical protein